MKQIALYLHLPFCRRRCAYCDFNAWQDPGETARRLYHEALLTDLHQEAARGGWRVSTIFFGGGTPSLAAPQWIAELLEACRDGFEVDRDAEITLEANPGTLDPGKLVRLREAGVNRLSIGVQALNDRLLAGIGRIHSAVQALQALDQARRAGFENLSLDLIYGLPGQTLADWQTTLERALETQPRHVSAYALSLEEGTPLENSVRKGEVRLPDQDAVADMEGSLRRTMRAGGYRQYEISNWSLPGRECRHNLVYWANGEYLGLGCGAASHLSGWRTRRLATPASYVQALSEGASPLAEAERLGSEQVLKETMILALRTRWGIDLLQLTRRFGVQEWKLRAFFDGLPGDLVHRTGRRVRLTTRGRDLANEVFVPLLSTALTLPDPGDSALGAGSAAGRDFLTVSEVEC
ncbi:MAG: radical SAM family heme chaperone HemW [Candidatus Xenobium sp.]|nr:radical SAM family heme chaperone HemW [Burkholderiales bacterium]